MRYFLHRPVVDVLLVLDDFFLPCHQFFALLYPLLHALRGVLDQVLLVVLLADT